MAVHSISKFMFHKIYNHITAQKQSNLSPMITQWGKVLKIVKRSRLVPRQNICLETIPQSVFNYYLNLFPVNCETSSWSSWAVCNRNGQTCGYKYGVQTRSRDILQIPSSNGEKCPSTTESQRCRLKHRSCVGMCMKML